MAVDTKETRVPARLSVAAREVIEKLGSPPSGDDLRYQPNDFLLRLQRRVPRPPRDGG
jgi:hypothetical protein